MAILNEADDSMFYVPENLHNMDFTNINAVGALQYAYNWVKENNKNIHPSIFYEALCETVRFYFSYCFAYVLKKLEGPAEIYWAALYGRFVCTKGKNGVPYDMHGLFEDEVMYLIPEHYVSHLIPDLMEISEQDKALSKPFVDAIRQYEKDNGLLPKPIIKKGKLI